MKKLSLTHILAIVAVGIIILAALIFYWAVGKSQQKLSLSVVTPPKNLNALTQISKNPSLNLLHGPLIILSENRDAAMPAQAVYAGVAYVLIQYQDDISGSSTPILAEPNKVMPIKSMNFFTNGSNAATGMLDAKAMRQAHLALAFYDRNGWLLVTSINNLNYDLLTYDVQNQSIVLQSQDHQQGKNLYGQLKEYA